MTILIFIAVLLVLILVHEFGHFIFAKFFKVRVDEFGIGYPPKAMKLAQVKETEYSLNWLPFGGFVRLFGEDKEEIELSEEEKERSFAHKKPWQKILILVAGAMFNFLLGWFLFAYVYYSGTPLFWDKTYVDNAQLLVSDTKPGSPAQIAGLSTGDIILDLSLKDKPKEKPKMLSPDFVALFISAHPGEVLSLKFKDKESSEIKDVELIPTQGIIDTEPDRAAVGMSMTLQSTREFGFFESLALGFKSAIDTSLDIIKGLTNLIKDSAKFSADLKNVAGPVGIAAMVGEAAQVGFGYLLYFTALISVNLAVINLLPIPALDGGRIVFVLYEWIFRRQAPAWFENSVNFAGFALLIILMLAVTYNDILRLLN